MKGYTSETIRNIALVGHGSTGKTTFLEASLLATGVSNIRDVLPFPRTPRTADF